MADVAANPPMKVSAADYPAELSLDAPLEVANWRPLVQWILGFPHYLIAWVLKSVAGLLAFIALFAILFTKKYPQGLFDMVALAFRYEWRTQSYVWTLRETYPPFEFDVVARDPATDPAKLSIAYPDELNRWLPLVKWFLVIPHLFVMVVRFVAAVFVGIGSFFVVLFTGKHNERMRNYLVDVRGYQLRVETYCYLMRDEYPPFALR
jgi:Domain of unknown function (DUF4389)